MSVLPSYMLEDAKSQSIPRAHNPDGSIKPWSEIINTQQMSLDALERIVKMNNATIEIGTLTAERLKSQSERIAATQERLDQLGSGTKRAGRELVAFIKGLACNVVIVILMLLVLLGAMLTVVIFTIMKIVYPNANVFNPNTYQPRV